MVLCNHPIAGGGDGDAEKLRNGEPESESECTAGAL